MTVAYPPHLVLAPPTTDLPDLSDLPPFLLNSRFVQAYLNCVALELQRIEQARQELLLSWFPASADTTLVFFEQMCGLAVNPPGLTVVERQQIVLAYMQAIKSEGTGLAWENSMTSFIGSPLGTGWTYVEHPGLDVTINVEYRVAVPVPSGLAAVPAAGGGTLGAGTYWYAVTALTTFGETLACTPVQAVVGATGHVSLSWTANPPVDPDSDADNDGVTTGYNIYRSTAGTADDIFGGEGTFGGTGTFGAPSGTPGVLYLIGSTTSAVAFSDTGLPDQAKIAPFYDTSAAPTGPAVKVYARVITPAHLDVIVNNVD